LAQARKVLSSWVQIDEQMVFGPVNPGALTMELNQVRGLEEQITDLENQLTDLRNRRAAHHQTVWDMLKRVRAGVKAIYGDDSSEYEMVGGTRTSERKSARRTAPPVE
ncbi:MAG TPA: hypothetical protein VFO91_01985, partial [Anaerolineales bacterium]|nr:hypothetical protein [Anaerolineales bacterium]